MNKTELKPIDPKLIRLGDIVQEYSARSGRFYIPMQVCGIFGNNYDDNVTLYLDFPGNESDEFEADAKNVYPVEISDDNMKFIGGVKEGDRYVVSTPPGKLYVSVDGSNGVHLAHYKNGNEEAHFYPVSLHGIQHFLYDRLKIKLTMVKNDKSNRK